MFRGHSYRSLDPKGRLMLPPEYREEVLRHVPDGRIMLTNNFDGAVSGYPMPVWEEVEASFKEGNKLDPRIRDLERFLISGAMEVVVDKQGRILIPPYLRSFADLDKELVLAGVGEKFEIWNQGKFEERRRQVGLRIDADLAALAELGVAIKL
ncbi:MAG: division/cell wall cluster transcriptional repressor MraZ [Solidesulfovibrio sp.]|uniref:division/cell wall cluster transcriptional repressor MraZ n=1 Tax=Solidesulfovibrio sp. TaxID=2910990 RepID=UPI002B214349|nr:division/cell wall cluster transcriptional repressor MraZ [Solidesulfovibrio sp.]MEA4857448.1 division/cell wall cluster transcriptional repressor MraZ [Solidesulfovibrio sp.]